MNEPLLQRARAMHQAGRLNEAAELYQQILLADPRQFEPFYSLGVICLQSGQLEDAQKLIGNALHINPKFAGGWCTLGLVLLMMKRPEDALLHFDRALSLQPDFPEALSSRGTALLELNRPSDALADFERVIALLPDHAITWNNRGNALAQMNRFEEAVESYDRALKLVPYLPQAVENRERALFQAKRMTRCPPGYMRNLFDGFAHHYDQTMLQGLGYRAHLHLRTLADRVLPPGSARLRVLDLGCGTGLVGDAFKDLAQGGRLDGIDIAPKMIEAARARGIYDDLILGDLESVLHTPGPSYDLMLAADTMIYLGDLNPTFTGAAERLATGAFYIFAAESKDGEGWQQTPAHRFRHSESYLRATASEAGLDVVDMMPCVLRYESNVPVAGMTVALRKATPSA
jgi:predicted TPR repeat methyltransferase